MACTLTQIYAFKPLMAFIFYPKMLDQSWHLSEYYLELISDLIFNISLKCTASIFIGKLNMYVLDLLFWKC